MAASLAVGGGGGSNLSVTRDEMVKGVLIKGIVCTPKAKAGSGNPFEVKRAAPKPPPPPGKLNGPKAATAASKR